VNTPRSASTFGSLRLWRDEIPPRREVPGFPLRLRVRA
jgi:hypothetical protein